MIDQAIVSLLSGNAAISTLVSDRIKPGVLPKDETLPAIVFYRITGARTTCHKGPSGLEQPKFQFDAIGSTLLQAKTIAAAIINAFDTEPPDTWDGIYISHIDTVNHNDPGYLPGSESYQVSVDAVIWHK